MPRRRRTILLTTLALTLPLLYLAYTRHRDSLDKHQLWVGCYSDAFPGLIVACQSAATDNAGRFPGPDTIISHLDPATRAFRLTCTGSHHPFIWNPRITTLSLSTPGPVPLLWCPPNSHGRHVGALLLTNGQIHPAMLTQPDLDHLLSSQPN